MSKQTSVPLNNYLRTHRRRIGFTQKEIAFLVGSVDSANVSHYEKSKHFPQLKTSFSYEIVFNEDSRKLFRGIFEKVKKDTWRRAKELLKEIEGSSPLCSSSQRKRQQKIEFLKKLTKGDVANLKDEE